MKFLNFLVLLTLISCSQGVFRKNISDSPYRTSGLEQFFLPELPAWANNSQSGQCFKKHSFQYLDFHKLGAVYQLKYPELIELQAQYNNQLETYFKSTSERFLKPVEEASFFSNSLENVRGGVKLLNLPKDSRKIDVIWLDKYISSNQVQELKKMNTEGRFDENLPIIFSSCFSKQDLDLWLKENNLDKVGFYLLTSEWLSPYNSDLSLKTGLHLELKKIFNQELEIKILSPDNLSSPMEIVL